MTKYEYKFLQIDINLSPILKLARWGVQVPGERKARDTMEGVEAYVTDLGREGWELVAVVCGNERTGIITRAVLFFKRPLTE
ncbi:MAG: DUF4177 domain-containing protein [candidate division WOR-3 bacterium]